LEVRWESEEDSRAQTFAALLVSTGATTFEAEEIERNWLIALKSGESIEIGDLGVLVPLSSGDTCMFEPNTAALASTFSSNRTVAIEPISKRALPDTPVTPTIGVDKQVNDSASAKTSNSVLRRLIPYASAAALVLLGVLAINYFSRSPNIDASLGKAVAVNQDRLNRSPREAATTADLPIERIEEALPSELIAGEPSATLDKENNLVLGSPSFPDSALPEIANNSPFDHSSAIPSEESSPEAAAFDPAGLAGGIPEEDLFEISEIDVVIVIGSFGNSANASRLTEKIAAAGLIPYVDQPGELTRVGATFSVSSEAEIEEVKHQMRKQFNPTAWVLE